MSSRSLSCAFWPANRVCADISSRVALSSTLDLGLESLVESHPSVKVFVGAVDEKLTASGMIQPGLGDVGDRLFGTQAEKPLGAVAGPGPAVLADEHPSKRQRE